MTANRPLPDVAFEPAALARALDWVGMEGIALPLRISDRLQVPAQADVGVNLIDPDRRGIHMSRLYLQLQQALPQTRLDALSLDALLAGLIESQHGASDRVQLVLRYDHLLERAALVSAHHGWKRYQVQLRCERDAAGSRHYLSVRVEYSSTCPASAALSRELNAQAFEHRFGGEGGVDAHAARDWLASKAGLAATPHAQRSVADVEVELADGFDQLPVAALADALEQALGTPVQTAVKREDEQAFAKANAENLMFCEDAARRVGAALAALPWVRAWQAKVAHLESLHAHDAVARVAGRND